MKFGSGGQYVGWEAMYEGALNQEILYGQYPLGGEEK